MEMISVESSHLEAIGYDPDNAILKIAFQDGSEYEYYDVPQYEYDSFYGSESKGTYANQNIYRAYRQQRVR